MSHIKWSKKKQKYSKMKSNIQYDNTHVYKIHIAPWNFQLHCNIDRLFDRWNRIVTENVRIDFHEMFCTTSCYLYLKSFFCVEAFAEKALKRKFFAPIFFPPKNSQFRLNKIYLWCCWQMWSKSDNVTNVTDLKPNKQTNSPAPR